MEVFRTLHAFAALTAAAVAIVAPLIVCAMILRDAARRPDFRHWYPPTFTRRSSRRRFHTHGTRRHKEPRS